MALNNDQIIKLLKSRPGQILIIPAGTRLYVLSADSDGNDVLISMDAEGNSFNDMTPEEVNQYIIDHLSHD